MARDDPHFRLRLPAELKGKIEHFAKANNRSINAEIVNRLEESIELSESLDDFAVERFEFEPVSMDDLLEQAEIQRGISREMVDIFEKKVEIAIEKAFRRILSKK